MRKYRIPVLQFENAVRCNLFWPMLKFEVQNQLSTQISLKFMNWNQLSTQISLKFMNWNQLSTQTSLKLYKIESVLILQSLKTRCFPSTLEDEYVRLYSFFTLKFFILSLLKCAASNDYDYFEWKLILLWHCDDSYPFLIPDFTSVEFMRHWPCFTSVFPGLQMRHTLLTNNEKHISLWSVHPVKCHFLGNQGTILLYKNWFL